MAIISSNVDITVIKGDFFEAPLFINMGEDSEPIRLEVNKFPFLEIYFGAYLPGQSFEKSVIRKKFTYVDTNEYGDVIIKLQPQDTKYLSTGKYYYSIKARIQDAEFGEWVYTVIERKNLFIK